MFLQRNTKVLSKHVFDIQSPSAGNQQYRSLVAAAKSTKKRQIDKYAETKDDAAKSKVKVKRGKLTIMQKIQLKSNSLSSSSSVLLEATSDANGDTNTSPTTKASAKTTSKDQKNKVKPIVLPVDPDLALKNLRAEMEALKEKKTQSQTKKKEEEEEKAKAKGAATTNIEQKKIEKTQKTQDETLELNLVLNLDTRQANQMLRTTVELPHGTGKKPKVLVFAEGEKAKEALDAGATYAGLDDLIKKIKDEKFLDFERCVATPEAVPKLAVLAKILGPKGLMPNKKLGTITSNIGEAVKSAVRGSMEVRAGHDGILNAPLGKMSFTDEQIKENLKAMLITLNDNKPSGSKGKLIKQASISTTQSKAVKLMTIPLDPASPFFMKPVPDEVLALMSSAKRS